MVPLFCSRYLYPPPSPSVIANIAQTLVAVPKFYTQVLHLMNKMNLPVPFGSLFELPSVYEDALKLLGYTERKARTKGTSEENNVKNIDSNTDLGALDKQEMRIEDMEDERRISPLRETTSESESELESDEDHAAIQKKLAPPMPAKRKIQPRHTINKRPRLSQLLQQQTCVPHQRTSEPSSVRDVFETGESDHEPRKLQLNLRDTVLPDKEAEESHEGNITLQEGGFGRIESLAADDKKKKEEETMEEWREKSKYITKEELLSNMVAKEGNV